MCRRSLLRLWKIALAVLLSAAAGCATYHPPRGSEKNVGFLVAVAPVWVASIDGRKYVHIGFKGQERIRLSPGTHLIEVQYSGDEDQQAFTWQHRPVEVRAPISSNQSVVLRLIAEAGQTYYVHGNRADNVWRPFISESRGPVFLDLPAR